MARKDSQLSVSHVHEGSVDPVASRDGMDIKAV